MNAYAALKAAHINLADPRLGAAALVATDEFFAPMARMLSPQPPEWRAGIYDDHGKWMDGWETRRRRGLGHDFCIVRLAAPCTLTLLDIDTSHFTGNYPPFASVEACRVEGNPTETTAWTELLARSALRGNQSNCFEVASAQVWTHLKLHIYPDGGVARFRAYGTVHHDWNKSAAAGDLIDLAAALNGGRALACNDEHYGAKGNLLLPGRGLSMADGWGDAPAARTGIRLGAAQSRGSRACRVRRDRYGATSREIIPTRCRSTPCCCPAPRIWT